METALSYITVLPSNKEEVRNFAKQIIATVESGGIDPLKLSLRLYWIEKLSEAISKPIKEAIMKEADKYGKSFEMMGVKVEQVEAGTKYDYSACNDPKWNELDEMIKKLGDQKKDREAFLKSINGHVEVPDETTGEMVVVTSPIKSSTTTLKRTAL